MRKGNEPSFKASVRASVQASDDGMGAFVAEIGWSCEARRTACRNGRSPEGGWGFFLKRSRGETVMARGKTTTPLVYCYSASGGAVTLSHDPKCRIRAVRIFRVRISEATGALVNLGQV